MKKVVLMGLSLVLVAVLSIGGTLAYLTDRDSEANVFTVGNVAIDLTEDFNDTELMPGKVIKKVPKITNTGSNDAWVWMTFAIPSALDNAVQGTQTGSDANVIHWNPLGATTEDYVTDERVTNAIAAGYLPAGTTAADILAKNTTWNVFNSIDTGKNMFQQKINGVDYNVYVLLYNKALVPGETTLPSIYNVFLDAQVDIDTDGDWHKVKAGVVTDINWNSNINGKPVIYVSAYAIQKDQFATVDEAYAAYNTQWGSNGTEYAPPKSGFEVSSNTGLANAVTAGESEIWLNEGTYTMPNTSSDVTISGTADSVVELPFTSVYGNNNTITIEGVTVQGENNGSWYSELFNGAEKVVYKNCIIKDQLTTYADSEFIGCTFENTFANDYSVYCYSGKNISFVNCKFNTECSKAIKVYDEGNGGRTVTVTNCEFNAVNSKKAAVEIDSTYSTYYVYITNCTINSAYSNLWNSDAGEDAGTNVCLDGTWVKGTAPAGN